MLSLIASIAALIISLYSNRLSRQNLDLVRESEERARILQRPLMRAVMEFQTRDDGSDNAVIQIYNDGPVLTDFKIEPKRFFLVDNSVLIPASLQPDMMSQQLIGTAQGLITVLDDISFYDFLNQYDLPDTVKLSNGERFWHIVEFNILLKITYSDVFHSNTDVYLLLSQTQLRGKYLEEKDAKLILEQVKINEQKLAREIQHYSTNNLIDLVSRISTDKNGFEVLDTATFNRLPFKYSASTEL